MKGAINITLDPYPGYESTTVDGEPAFVYPRGAHLTGIAYIDATEMIKARGVEVDLRWQTSGKGDRNHWQSSPIVIHPGGELIGALELPFAIDLPLAPLSYSGTLIKIDWLVRVRIDRPWALDMKLEIPVVVV